MVTALARLKMKSLVAWVTASGWKLISPISMPTGWWRLSYLSLRRTPSPMVTTLPTCTVPADTVLADTLSADLAGTVLREKAELAAHAGMTFAELVSWMVEEASCDR